jgi:pimeloyl-ACP methyl ester carboxylesterase
MGRFLLLVALLTGGLGACRPALLPAKPAHVQAAPSTGGGSSSRDRTPFARRVGVGQVELYILCQGAGRPTVVFESGLGLDSSAWWAVQQKVSEFTRACAYDRAGRGKSGPAPYPHGQQQMAQELYGLLRNAEQAGPYVLVGHSMGGAIVRWFQRAHPEQVSGMVLVDAAGEDLDFFYENLAKAPPDAVPEFWRNLRNWEGLDQESLVAGYAGLRGSAGALADRPLVILTSGQPAADLPRRLRAQSMLPALSSNSVARVVDDSGHNIPFERPAWVARAVRAVVDAARSGRALDSRALAE